jgi:hypothetical protein
MSDDDKKRRRFLYLDEIAKERILERLRIDMARVGSPDAPPCPVCIVNNAVAPAVVAADWRCGRCLTFWNNDGTLVAVSRDPRSLSRSERQARATDHVERTERDFGRGHRLYLGAERENRPLPWSDRAGGRAC